MQELFFSAKKPKVRTWSYLLRLTLIPHYFVSVILHVYSKDKLWRCFGNDTESVRNFFFVFSLKINEQTIIHRLIQKLISESGILHRSDKLITLLTMLSTQLESWRLSLDHVQLFFHLCHLYHRQLLWAELMLETAQCQAMSCRGFQKRHALMHTSLFTNLTSSKIEPTWTFLHASET